MLWVEFHANLRVLADSTGRGDWGGGGAALPSGIINKDRNQKKKFAFLFSILNKQTNRPCSCCCLVSVLRYFSIF